jgi:hypothetical protein
MSWQLGCRDAPGAVAVAAVAVAQLGIAITRSLCMLVAVG